MFAIRCSCGGIQASGANVQTEETTQPLRRRPRIQSSRRRRRRKPRRTRRPRQPRTQTKTTTISTIQTTITVPREHNHHHRPTIMIMIRIMTIIIDHGDQETTKPPPTSSPPTYATQQAPFHGHPIIAQSMVCRSNTSTNRHHIMPGDRSIDRSIDDMEWRTMGWAVGGECVRGGNHTPSLACVCAHMYA